jgi:uncharacterized RDD family membrane protein YckC
MERIVQEIKYAGFWARILAGIIDDIIFIPFELIRQKSFPHNWNVILAGYILIGIYCIFFWMRYSATPGMMLLRIKLIAKEGSHFTIGRAILRYIGLQISSFTIIGGLWMLWDKHKQMWHDKFAGTYVIKRIRKSAGESGRRIRESGDTYRIQA